MPTAVDPLADERFAELVAQLRAAPPSAPHGLRERVRAAAAAQPPPPRRRALAGGAARVLVPALVVGLVVGGGFLGSRSAGPGGDEAGEGAVASAPALRARIDEGEAGDAELGLVGSPAGSESAGTAWEPLAPAPAPGGRLQEQRIELGVRVADVDALSEATARAMATARSLGGYVVAAHYAVPSAEGGDSTLVFRMPSAKVQEAIARLTALGTIASQDVRLQDLQPAYDRRAREIQSLRTRIARLERELAATGLAEEERARLRTQLAAARRGLDARLAQQQATEQRGSLARIALTLTTRDAAAAVGEGGAAGTLKAAAELLSRLLVWLLAGLIVAGPFLALALVALLVARGRRRLLEARLLERA